MKLIVGLGNPDKQYINTRHNVGFMVLDDFANATNLNFKPERKFKGDICLTKEFILLKPMTYMNLSGESVQAVSSYYKILPKDILVISDDFNLPFEKLRLRASGSAGGHNGLKSIIQQLGSMEFNRLRVGIGDPGNDSVDFVLGKFSKNELDVFKNKVYPVTRRAIDLFIKDTKLDNIFNKIKEYESLS